MRLLAVLSLVLLNLGCSYLKTRNNDKIKLEPEYGLEIKDPDVQILVDEFFLLAEQSGVSFTKQVSIGITDHIRDYHKTAIGLCTYNARWREIDIDKKYWKTATWTSKISLVFHELTHAYCYRDHDWAAKHEYQDPRVESVLRLVDPVYYRPSFIREPDGYFNDGCPITIMHPVILDDECMNKHYSRYIVEMFERCQPY